MERGEDMKVMREVVERIETKNSKLNDEAINEIITRIFFPKITNKKGVVYISSLNLSNVLSREYNGYYEKIVDEKEREKRVKKQLGILNGWQTPDDLSTIIVVIHGPHTEKEKNENCVYNFDINEENDHWSLLVWYSKEEIAYHYDSLDNHNYNRCREALRVLRKYNAVPAQLSKFRVPGFVPLQKGSSECGYYVLLFVKILTDSCENSDIIFPITEDLVLGYKQWLDTINQENGKLRKFVLRKMDEQINALVYDNLLGE